MFMAIPSGVRLRAQPRSTTGGPGTRRARPAFGRLSPARPSRDIVAIDDPHRLEHRDELAVARGPGERDVEVAARVVPRSASRAFASRSIVAYRRSRSASVRARRRPGRSPARRAPGPRAGAGRRRCWAGGAEASVRDELGEALAGQAAQRLAHRGARDPELLGELDLAESRAGRDLALDDHRPDALVRQIDHRVGPDMT